MLAKREQNRKDKLLEEPPIMISPRENKNKNRMKKNKPSMDMRFAGLPESDYIEQSYGGSRTSKNAFGRHPGIGFGGDAPPGGGQSARSNGRWNNTLELGSGRLHQQPQEEEVKTTRNL